jgi:hypothetical protein
VVGAAVSSRKTRSAGSAAAGSARHAERAASSRSRSVGVFFSGRVEPGERARHRRAADPDAGGALPRRAVLVEGAPGDAVGAGDLGPRHPGGDGGEGPFAGVGGDARLHPHSLPRRHYFREPL